MTRASMPTFIYTHIYINFQIELNEKYHQWKPRASINAEYLNRPENKKVQNKGLKLLNVVRGYSNNFKQNKRDFCPFLNGILLRFFKKVYPNLLCVPKKEKKNWNKETKCIYIYKYIHTSELQIAKERHHWNKFWQRNKT